jgi:hypothetical protein
MANGIAKEQFAIDPQIPARTGSAPGQTQPPFDALMRADGKPLTNHLSPLTSSVRGPGT